MVSREVKSAITSTEVNPIFVRPKLGVGRYSLREKLPVATLLREMA